MGGLILDWRPEVNALWHGDRTLLPAIEFWRELLETPKLYHQGLDTPGINQPMAVWIRMSLRHWIYSRMILRCLEDELMHRTGQPKSKIIIKVPRLPVVRFIRPPLLVPGRYWWGSVPLSNCLYYLNECRPHHDWSRRSWPWWVDRDMSEPCLIHLDPDQSPPPLSLRIGGVRPGSNKARIRSLRGHHLICQCKKPPCYGRLVLELANRTD